MNHPNREQWVSFLYNEVTKPERAEFAQHLASCPQCSAQLGEWRGTQRQLDSWKTSHRQPSRWLPVLKWAAAAVLFLGTGYTLGRNIPSALDLQTVRAAIEPALRQELTEQLDRTMAARLSSQASTISDLMTALDERYSTTAVSLKKDIDTMAYLTEAGFRRTENQLVRLADYTRPLTSDGINQQ